MRRLIGATLASVVVAAGVLVVGAGPAAADDCAQASCANEGAGGYTVSVTAVVTGDGVGGGGGGGGSVTVSVPPVCFWFNQSENLRVGSIAELREVVDYEGDTRMGANDAIWDNPPDSWWDTYIAAEAGGANLTAYEPSCQDGNSSSGGDLTMLNAYGLRSSPYGLVISATGPPDPVIDPSVLIQVADDAMDLGVPAVDHNPKARALGGGTLVDIDTYFWVTDPRSLGGGDGELVVRATALGVWAEVTATNGGLTLTSPAGSADCSRQQGLTAYGTGGTPCVLNFSRASVGSPAGWPVTAVSAWDARYELSDGETGGLGTRAEPAPAQPVPVGESQSLVTGTR